MHRDKNRKFLKMMNGYRQRHYERGNLSKLLYQQLKSPATTLQLASQLRRSPSRISKVLSSLRIDGRVRMCKVHSSYYWVRSDVETIVISHEEERILKLLSVPRTLCELAKALARDKRSVSHRLDELGRLGLVARANSKWVTFGNMQRVIVR